MNRGFEITGLESFAVGRLKSALLRPPTDEDLRRFDKKRKNKKVSNKEWESNTVHLPPGRWRYFFDDSKVLEGPTVFDREFPLDEYPVYLRDGAIVPMRLTRAYTGIGEEDWADYLTLDIYPLGTSTFTVHHPDKKGSTRVTVREGESLSIDLEGTAVPHLLRVYLERAPTKVSREGEDLEEGADWEYREGESRLIVRSKLPRSGAYEIEVQGPSS